MTPHHVGDARADRRRHSARRVRAHATGDHREGLGERIAVRLPSGATAGGADARVGDRRGLARGVRNEHRSGRIEGDELGAAPDVAEDERQPRGGRLGGRDGPSLEEGVQQEGIGRQKQGARVRVAQKMNPIALWAAAPDRIGTAELGPVGRVTGIDEAHAGEPALERVEE